MNYKFEYKDEEERTNILNENSTLVLVEEQNIAEGNFLIFVDANTREEMVEAQKLNSRVSDISTYLSNNATTIADVEDLIIQSELNKILKF